jgi:hypothetical protein
MIPRALFDNEKSGCLHTEVYGKHCKHILPVQPFRPNAFLMLHAISIIKTSRSFLLSRPILEEAIPFPSVRPLLPRA